MEEKKVEEKKDNANGSLLKAACKAYGIDPEYVLSSRVTKKKEVIIVTNGGIKVRWRPGDKVEELDPIRVDGKIRKKMRVVAGKKR